MRENEFLSGNKFCTIIRVHANFDAPRYGGKVLGMSLLRSISLVSLLLVATPVLNSDQSGILDSRDLDARLLKGVADAINSGAALYNKDRDYVGCFRLYEGALKALYPVLDHRPGLQTAINRAMERAALQRTPAEQAHALRLALDEIYESLKVTKAVTVPGKVTPVPTMVAGQSVYDRMGGEYVRLLGAEFFQRLMEDERLNVDKKNLTNGQKDRMKQAVMNYLVAATGGLGKSEGRSLRSIFREMKWTDAEHRIVIEDLKASMGRWKVAPEDQRALIAIAESAGSATSDTTSTSSKDENFDPGKKTLYSRLGGDFGIRVLVSRFVDKALADPRVNFKRVDVPGVTAWEASDENVAKLKKAMTSYVAALTGGSKPYEGRTMKAAHRGMKITDAEFQALMADLRDALAASSIPDAEQKDLLALVALAAAEMVEKP